MLTRPGELAETCAECRHVPNACSCPPLSAATPDSPDGIDEAKFGRIAAAYAPVDWRAAWKAQPEDVEWLLEPLLEEGTVNALFGKPGTGKSLITLEIALRLVRAGHVIVYVDQENRITDLVERLQAFGAEPEELDRLRMYSFAGLPPLDTVTGGVHLLALAVTAGAALVVIDTTSRLIQGKENDADTFLALYRCSLVPLKARGITVLRLDHPGKDESRGQRGSSAKEGDVDTIWRLVQAGPAAFRLEREKSRSGHGEPAVEMHRRFGPLRHEWAVRGDSPAGQLCGQLEALGVPPGAGRPAVRKALDAAGVKVSNALLTEAIRLRKNCPGQLADSPDSSAGVSGCPSVPLIGTDSRTAPVPDRSRAAGPRPDCTHPACWDALAGECLAGRGICVICGTALDPRLAQAGHSTHPNCEPEAA
jgi:hypothetical protein